MRDPDASVVLAVGYARVAVPTAIAVVVVSVVSVVAVIAIAIVVPILPTAVFIARRIALHRIGDAAGQADQGRCKCNQG